MIRSLREALLPAKIEEIEAKAIADAEAGRDEAAWKHVRRLLQAQRGDENAALAVVRIVDRGHVSRERALEALEQIYAAHPRSERVLGLLGEALEQARDIDMLNSPPPEPPIFREVVKTLEELLPNASDAKIERELLFGLKTAARMLARQHDALVESSSRRLIELEPERSSHHYNFGLFLKTRGRFAEGVAANQRAIELSTERIDAYEWNLGICATGAGQGALALEVWKRMGQHIEMGRFDLPEGGYRQCKVRLAERPLAERGADNDDPGLEETIWIERLSPCHGVIRSVLYQDLGVTYGDVILIDGAPITYHKYGEDEVPVFPHLATLVKRNYRCFDFAGSQGEAGQLADASEDLERDAIVYSLSENYKVVCAECWRNPNTDHKHDETHDKHIVTGKIAAPPDIEPRELLRQLDAAIAKRGPCRIYVPDLCEAAGLPERAAVERRRFEMIASD